MEKDIVGKNYQLISKIGQGSFGKIYIAEHILTKEKFAVKLEESNCRVPQLLFESRLYQVLSHGINVPRLHYYGIEMENNVMVIDLLGKSLEELFNLCDRKFSLKTVLMLADQMISSIEFIHQMCYIHRDIKPDNFVMGVGKNSNQVYIIDYGLAKKYIDNDTNEHILFSGGKSLTGTARYASVNALSGCEQSRRDDLEALGFVLVYFLQGQLPWMGIIGKDRQLKYSKICEQKKSTSFESLCKGLPNEFLVYFQEIRSYSFTQKPNYIGLRKLFRELFLRKGYIYDYKYDWTDLNGLPRDRSREEMLTFDEQIKVVGIELVPKRSVDLPIRNENIHSPNKLVPLPEKKHEKSVDLPKFERGLVKTEKKHENVKIIESEYSYSYSYKHVAKKSSRKRDDNVERKRHDSPRRNKYHVHRNKVEGDRKKTRHDETTVKYKQPPRPNFIAVEDQEKKNTQRKPHDKVDDTKNIQTSVGAFLAKRTSSKPIQHKHKHHN